MADKIYTQRELDSAVEEARDEAPNRLLWMLFGAVMIGPCVGQVCSSTRTVTKTETREVRIEPRKVVKYDSAFNPIDTTKRIRIETSDYHEYESEYYPGLKEWSSFKRVR